MATYEDKDYRKIEAMMGKDMDTNFIISQCPNLARYQVIDIMQIIYGRKMAKLEKEEHRNENPIRQWIRPERKTGSKNGSLYRNGDKKVRLQSRRRKLY